jgi:hypothetical protein
MLFYYFSFQCSDLIKEHTEVENELDLVKKNARVNKHEMDGDLVRLDISRKRKKLELLKAEFDYQRYRQRKFSEQRTTMGNL